MARAAGRPVFPGTELGPRRGTVPGGYRKGFLLARLKERLHADLSVAVGDYENDITLLRMADIGYAVSNALPCTLAAADRVTVSGGENALAKIIFEL